MGRRRRRKKRVQRNGGERRCLPEEIGREGGTEEGAPKKGVSESRLSNGRSRLSDGRESSEEPAPVEETTSQCEVCTQPNPLHTLPPPASATTQSHPKSISHLRFNLLLLSLPTCSPTEAEVEYAPCTDRSSEEKTERIPPRLQLLAQWIPFPPSLHLPPLLSPFPPLPPVLNPCVSFPPLSQSYVKCQIQTLECSIMVLFLSRRDRRSAIIKDCLTFIEEALL